MQLLENPNQSQIEELLKNSFINKAKWHKDSRTGKLYYWQAELAYHNSVAEMLGITEFEKGSVG